MGGNFHMLEFVYYGSRWSTLIERRYRLAVEDSRYRVGSHRQQLQGGGE